MSTIIQDKTIGNVRTVIREDADGNRTEIIENLVTGAKVEKALGNYSEKITPAEPVESLTRTEPVADAVRRGEARPTGFRSKNLNPGS